MGWFTPLTNRLLIEVILQVKGPLTGGYVDLFKWGGLQAFIGVIYVIYISFTTTTWAHTNRYKWSYFTPIDGRK